MGVSFKFSVTYPRFIQRTQHAWQQRVVIITSTQLSFNKFATLALTTFKSCQTFAMVIASGNIAIVAAGNKTFHLLFHKTNLLSSSSLACGALLLKIIVFSVAYLIQLWCHCFFILKYFGSHQMNVICNFDTRFL